MLRCVFGFIVMNGESYLVRNIRRIMAIASKHFQDSYCICFIENDSTDKTRVILKHFMHTYPNLFIGEFLNFGDHKHSTELCDKDTDSYNCSKRTQRLAKLRNKVLDLVPECDYFVMLDMDFVILPDPTALFHRLDSHPSTNAVFGISVIHKHTNHFYDLGAFAPKSLLMIYVFLLFFEWIPIHSCFSGFGAYRWSCVRNIRYNTKCKFIEHNDFNMQISGKYVTLSFNPEYDGVGKFYTSKTFYLFVSILLIVVLTCCIVCTVLILSKS